MTVCHIINPPLTHITNQCLPRHHLLSNTNPNPNLSFSLFRTNPLCSRRTSQSPHSVTVVFHGHRSTSDYCCSSSDLAPVTPSPENTATRRAASGSNLHLPHHREPATTSPSSRLSRASFFSTRPAHETSIVAPFELAGTVYNLRQHSHHHFSILAHKPPNLTPSNIRNHCNRACTCVIVALTTEPPWLHWRRTSGQRRELLRRLRAPSSPFSSLPKPPFSNQPRRHSLR
ncbi:hypothetical protein DEO72_LG8g2552 [Vigna unguiculata]|uniref:Uncharacterized protein n=1 Tax=Vigna unguiculata TaxID=3917 RepID=A0A4D6MSS2_VIGUN|nr:hypothetical protein DEO72_LG8g2552 [Vigna unguiculata]